MVTKRLTSAATTVLQGLGTLVTGPSSEAPAAPTPQKRPPPPPPSDIPAFSVSVTPQGSGTCSLTFSGTGLGPGKPLTCEGPGIDRFAFDVVSADGTYSNEASFVADGTTITFTAIGVDGKAIVSTVRLKS